MTPPIVHGSFTLERTFKASPARAFAAWTDIETKAAWFMGPPERWKLLRRELDLRVGGREILHGKLVDGHETLFVARYHVIEPNERLVYVYDMSAGALHLSVSLATVEFSPTREGGTRMLFTEQAAFLDGQDGTKSREIGTAAHLDRLSNVLSDPRDIVSTRVLEAPRERVFRAFGDPEELARWWGPKGFNNDFAEFDLRPGGVWRFVMRGPNGEEYRLVKQFVEVTPPERVVLRQEDAVHGFTMTQILLDLGARTALVWRMRFDSAQEAERVRAFIETANEENLDRLEAHLSSG